MIQRVKLALEQIDYTAPLELARLELRLPDEQARCVLRQELIRRGLLQSESDARTTQDTPRDPSANNVKGKDT